MNTKGPAAKWRSEKPSRANTGGSIRGKTISQPIPFPDDDEFPIRTPGTGIALPLGPEAMEREMRLRTSTATEELRASGPPRAEPTNGFNPSRETPIFSANQSTNSGRQNMPKPMRNSMAASSVGTAPERKKSGLRSVFGRIFGKKRKSSTATKPAAGNTKAAQHQSVPSALNGSPQGTTNPQKRSASLPINEFNRALRSHSIVADDILLSSKDRDSFQSNVQRRSRRATTPSRLWTPNRTPGYIQNWTGLSPRPASTHGRGSRVLDDNSGAIGTAVTSGSHPNRRSRSVGEMRDTALRTTVSRRRSDEIRYWRESYDPGLRSPMSSNRAEEQEPILAEAEHHPCDILVDAQPQPFNFGPMGELAGMKITQAASLETRVHRLEDRVSKMERMISRSLENMAQERGSSKRRSRNGSTVGQNAVEEEMALPRHRQHLHDPMPPKVRSASYGSSRPSTNDTHNSYHPSFDNSTFSPTSTHPTSQPLLSASQTTARPLSTSTTIRGLPPSSPVSKDGFLTGEHYTLLTNLILNEQSARQHLESVISTLQEQVRALSSHSQQYTMTGSGSERDHDHKIGEFSSFEQDDSEDDGEARYIHDEDVFQTPREEFSGGFGEDAIFGTGNGGELLRNSASEEVKRRDDRTLSLSQITMGKGVQHALNF